MTGFWISQVAMAFAVGWLTRRVIRLDRDNNRLWHSLIQTGWEPSESQAREIAEHWKRGQA
jgi:hypothetical protein